MVGSIDPRCETIRGTHWPRPGRVVVWNSRRGNHLGQRSKPTASTGRTYGCKRSDQTAKTSCATGAVHIWVPAQGRDDGDNSNFKQPVARMEPTGRANARPMTGSAQSGIPDHAL